MDPHLARDHRNHVLAQDPHRLDAVSLMAETTIIPIATSAGLSVVQLPETHTAERDRFRLMDVDAARVALSRQEVEMDTTTLAKDRHKEVAAVVMVIILSLSRSSPTLSASSSAGKEKTSVVSSLRLAAVSSSSQIQKATDLSASARLLVHAHVAQRLLPKSTASSKTVE
jgi:hypothetical protein